MADEIDDRKVFSLFEVTRSIQKTIADRYTSSFWVKAEMNKLNHYPHSGHAYPELVEKKEGKTIAEMRSIIWKDDFNRVNAKFLSVLKEPLKDGINVLFLAKIGYDPKYGLSLNILDIDPSFSLGELEREKQETITKLKQEGIYDLNRNLKLALLPKRIAIVSVSTSKGYSDFIKVISGNAWGYNFFHHLFPAILQGEKAVTSILSQLKRISRHLEHFDAVAIIRGGGGDVGLSCYNDHRLAKAVASFPIPVFTGIGHSTNETVTEMVAYKNAITPTELADFLLQKFHNFSMPVQRAQEVITNRSKQMMRDNNLQLASAVRLFKSSTRNMINTGHYTLRSSITLLTQQSILLLKESKSVTMRTAKLLPGYMRQLLVNNKRSLSDYAITMRKDSLSLIIGERVSVSQEQQLLKRSSLQKLKDISSLLSHSIQRLNAMDPINVLKRGYSITHHKGKAITNSSEVQKGDKIITILANGTLISRIE